MQFTTLPPELIYNVIDHCDFLTARRCRALSKPLKRYVERKTSDPSVYVRVRNINSILRLKKQIEKNYGRCARKPLAAIIVSELNSVNDLSFALSMFYEYLCQYFVIVDVYSVDRVITGVTTEKENALVSARLFEGFNPICDAKWKFREHSKRLKVAKYVSHSRRREIEEDKERRIAEYYELMTGNVDENLDDRVDEIFGGLY